MLSSIYQQYLIWTDHVTSKRLGALCTIHKIAESHAESQSAPDLEMERPGGEKNDWF